MLAARALGLGTVLTTLHHRRKAQSHAILGIPDHIESAAIIPLGWPEPAAATGAVCDARPLERLGAALQDSGPLLRGLAASDHLLVR
jgi:nitroreductase